MWAPGDVSTNCSCKPHFVYPLFGTFMAILLAPYTFRSVCGTHFDRAAPTAPAACLAGVLLTLLLLSTCVAPHGRGGSVKPANGVMP